MTWHLKSVPKILHTYWSGHLVYLRYLTIKSFIKYNPDWKVFIWYPVNPHQPRGWGNTSQELLNKKLCRDYYDDLFKLPVERIPINFDNLKFARATPEVHKADYIRINALHLYGGVWTDMDIIYFKSLEKLEVNKKENSGAEVFVCIGPYGHSTGFNMATPASRFFKTLTEKFNTDYRATNYQCWGPDMFNRYFKTIRDIPAGVNLQMDTVYAYDCHHAGELLGNEKMKFNANSIGCHWYAGNSLWGDFLNHTGGGEKNVPNCIIKTLIDGV